MNKIPNINLKRSITAKIIIIGVIALGLMIPTLMIDSLIHEREWRRDDAIREVSSKWSGEQNLIGPILSVPYKKFVQTNDDKTIEQTAYAYFLPEELNVDGNIEPNKLNRGIYEIVTYNSKLKFDGNFKKPDFKELNIAEEYVILKDVSLLFLISDMRGINEDIIIDFGDKKMQAKPGIPNQFRFPKNTGNQITKHRIAMELEFLEREETVSGINIKFPLENTIQDLKENYAYSFRLNLKGSESINFSPVGNVTKVSLNSTYDSPSFQGAFLPTERELTENGFSANWSVLGLNRNFAQSWTGAVSNAIFNSSFGVDLIIPVDEYQKTSRSIKYAILFIALTFLTFFFSEVLNKVQIHPLQYILVGLSLLEFFVLLLGVSEHISFNLAYLIAAFLTIATITLYAKTIFKDTRLTFVQTGILSFLYLFIFIIIQLEDYALLVGSLGLFTIIAIVMFVSRKINWYEQG